MSSCAGERKLLLPSERLVYSALVAMRLTEFTLSFRANSVPAELLKDGSRQSPVCFTRRMPDGRDHRESTCE